jgi:hypothetical protein
MFRAVAGSPSISYSALVVLCLASLVGCASENRSEEDDIHLPAEWQQVECEDTYLGPNETARCWQTADDLTLDAHLDAVIAEASSGTGWVPSNELCLPYWEPTPEVTGFCGATLTDTASGSIYELSMVAVFGDPQLSAIAEGRAPEGPVLKVISISPGE